MRRLPGRIAQSVTCLATDTCLTADPGVASSIPAQSHTFVEIDHEIISTVILLPSADPFKNRRVAEIQIFEKTYLIVIKDETGLKFKMNDSTLFLIGSYAQKLVASY